MSYSTEVLADSPLAWYRLGDSSGTTMTDSSGNSRNGTYSGSPTLGAASLIGDLANTAVSFDGVNDLGIVTVAAWMQPTVITVEAWIKPTSVTSVTQEIASRNDATTAFNSNDAWRFTQINNTLFARVFVNGSSTTVSLTSSACLTAGATHHVVFTFDGSNIVIYCNGSQVGTTALSGTLNPGTYDLNIGRSSQGTASFFTGVIDEVALYGSALSSTRVSAHYTAGAATTVSPPAATATASAPAPAVSASSTVTAVSATATASMPAPTVSVTGGGSASVAAVAGAAAASAPAPAVTGDVINYIFRPPTTAIPLDPSARDFLWSRVRIQRGIAVLKLNSGAFVQQVVHDPDTADVAKVYMGGADNLITGAEAADLTAAGYGSYLTAV